jgi:hypothetical protein
MRERTRQKNMLRRKRYEIIEWKDINGYHIKTIEKMIYLKDFFK